MTRDGNIRALYLQPAAHFGGAERQAATIVPLLGEMGVETTPFVGPGDEIVQWLQQRGVDELIHSPSFPGPWPSARGIRQLGRLWSYARCILACRRELARVIVEREIDVVFAAMAFSWISATPVARALGVPIVWRAGGTECSERQRRWLRAWARWNPPDRLVCNGDSVRQLFAPMIGAPATVIRNGLDTRQFHVGAGNGKALRPPGAKLVIGFAARLVPQKRPEDFIAAASHFASRDDVAFLMAGEGSRRPQYEALIETLGAKTVCSTGFVHEMRDFYDAIDVLVLPSRSEGCPNVVLEAMASGVAVVAADAPATREIVTDGSDGVLYPIGDIAALAQALAMMIDRPDWRRMLAARGHQRVTRLSAHECAARTADLLIEVASHRRIQAPARYQALRA
jgi:glycosyltransferase involved in cell wall biosynthesis